LVILEFKEKLAQEGFLVFLAYQVPADHLDLRGTEDCLVILDLRGWEWKDHQDPQDLMELLDHLELENQDHKDLEDLQEKVVVQEFRDPEVHRAEQDTARLCVDISWHTYGNLTGKRKRQRN